MRKLPTKTTRAKLSESQVLVSCHAVGREQYFRLNGLTIDVVSVTVNWDQDYVEWVEVIQEAEAVSG